MTARQSNGPPGTAAGEPVETLYRLPTYEPGRARRIAGAVAAALAADLGAALLAASCVLAARWRWLAPLGPPWLRLPSYPQPRLLAIAAASTLALAWLAARPQWRLGAAPGLPLVLTLWLAAVTPLYPPLAVLRWGVRYGGRPALAADLRLARAVLGGTAATLAAASLALAWERLRHLAETGDTHGSSHWAAPREVAAAALLDPPPVAGRRAGRRRPPAAAPPPGVVLGGWRDPGGRLHRLRDRGDRHVLAFAPTGSGKSTSLVIPTLLEWPSSVVVLDIKGELWLHTAGYRRSVLGQACLRFDPSAADGSTAAYNPLLAIPRDLTDVQHAQAVADVLIDPAGRDRPRTFWEQRAHALLVATLLHVLYARPDKTLAGCARLLSDPAQPIQRTLEAMLATRHDPTLARGWQEHDGDGRGAPTPTHPVVAGAARALLDMDPRTASGVIATAQAQLDLFRDPILAANTAACDFAALDLVAGERPVSLYITLPPGELERLRAPLRLVLNQLCRALTTTPPRVPSTAGAPAGAAGHAAGNAAKHAAGHGTDRAAGEAPRRRPLLLLLDEFTALGRLDFFGRALAYLRGYDIRVYLSIQALVQLLDIYGPYQSITANCGLQVAFTPADLETAELLSRMTGLRTINLFRRSLHTGASALAPQRTSLARGELGRALLSPDEVRRLPADQALVFAAGHAPIRALRLPYFLDPELAARARLPPPAASDRLNRSAGAAMAATEDAQVDAAAAPESPAALTPAQIARVLRGHGRP